jgi:plasmid maintenance system killer protein
MACLEISLTDSAAAMGDPIRINDQWRICFVWEEGGPAHVEIVDYHV